MTGRQWSRLLLAAAVLACLAALTGCGSSSSSSSKTTATTATTTKTAAAPAVAHNRRASVPPNPGSPSATRKPTTSALNSVHAGKPGGPAPHLAGFDESSVTGFIHQIDSDVGAFWQGQFNQAGYQYSPVNEEIITQAAPPITSGCGGFQWTTNTFNAAYCGADNTFYLPLNFLTYVFKKYGDSATAAVIAHENGHHVQKLLGIIDAYAAGKLQTIQIELQADCMAGVWMSSIYQHNQVSPTDVVHALELFNDLGDPTGTTPTTPGAHGGPRQRMSAFLQGYNSGQGGACQIPALPTKEA